MKKEYKRAVIAEVDNYQVPVKVFLERIKEGIKSAESMGCKDVYYEHGEIIGVRLETDKEFERREKKKRMLDKRKTEDLVQQLRYESSSRQQEIRNWEYERDWLTDFDYFPTDLNYETLKEVLDAREHIPNSIQKRIIRKLKAKYKIKSNEELYEKHSDEMDKMYKAEKKRTHKR